MSRARFYTAKGLAGIVTALKYTDYQKTFARLVSLWNTVTP